MKTSKIVLICAVGAIILFTAAIFIVKAVFDADIPEPLIYCWFGFWSVELASMAGITRVKVKNHYYESAGVVTDEDEEADEEADEVDEADEVYDNDNENEDEN